MKNNGKIRSTNEQCTAEGRHGFAHPFLILAFTFLISHFSFLTSNAQTFTQRIQRDGKGTATMTIHQSDSISVLVNDAMLGPAATSQPSSVNSQQPSSGSHLSSFTNNSVSASRQTGNQPSLTSDTETEPTTVDTSKKMIRNGYKVNGYRVQAFAGGNSRKDRQQAERIGNNIKANFPDVPVYVHFYSPRWICRVGNYRTYEEAHQMLSSLRKMGYSQSTIVKGKITVSSY